MTYVFGESFQKARHSYHCDICHRQIESGEQYRRWLWKVNPQQVIVIREHLDCPPDEPPHDEEAVLLRYDYVLPLAA